VIENHDYAVLASRFLAAVKGEHAALHSRFFP
jgi:hypothetical protein